MQLSERRVGGVTIIDITGDLTVPDNPGALREKVLALLQRGECRILLNVENLRHMDSSCLGEIVASYTATASTGGMLKLEHVGPHLRDLLHTTKLDAIFELYDTENEAIASFGKTGPIVT